MHYSDKHRKVEIEEEREKKRLNASNIRWTKRENEQRRLESNKHKEANFGK